MMKYRKQLLALCLSGLLLLTGCGTANSGSAADGSTDRDTPQPEAQEPSGDDPAETYSTFHAAALKGPTAMGMVYMMAEDGMDRYTLAGAADEVTPLLIKGDLDIACVPANLASVLYNRTEGDIVTLAINTLGVLYIVENGDSIHSIEDLRGQTIVSAGKGSTPEYGLRYLLQENGLDPDQDVTIDWKNEHSECVAALAAGSAQIAMLPQPFVTAAQANMKDLRTALDLTAEWDALDNGSAMLTGVVVARRAFVEEQTETVERFLRSYAASVAWVNEHPADAGELIAEFGIVESAAIAEQALPYCNIVCITGTEMQEKLTGYLQILFDASPDAVGGALPGDGFCYVP